jgi:hypothetical protein
MSDELPGFETLRYLAEHEPEALERLRRRLIEQLIANAPPHARRRLRGLQFQIDARCKLARNPVAACVVVSGMMHETLGHLQQALRDWTAYIEAPPAPPAKLLQFPASPRPH